MIAMSLGHGPQDGARARYVSASAIPLYHQVYTVLRQRLSDGTYEPGARLPAEGELSSEFQVSRATIRQAVGELVRLQLVSRNQGRGTFAIELPRHPSGQRFRGSLSDLIKETRRARVKDVTIRLRTSIPPAIAHRLHLKDSVATVIQRTRMMDGQIFAYTVNFLPEDLGRLLSERELRSNSLMHTLEEKGVRLLSAIQSIHAQVADLSVSRRLEVPFGAPVLYVERTLFGEAPNPLEFVQSWYRGDRYEYSVTLDLTSRSEEGLGAHLA
jgi:GntR family transcriptional regulator